MHWKNVENYEKSLAPQTRIIPIAMAPSKLQSSRMFKYPHQGSCVKFVCWQLGSLHNKAEWNRILHENFTRDVSFDKEELIKFWRLSISVSASRNFLDESSTLQDGTYVYALAHISGKTD